MDHNDYEKMINIPAGAVRSFFDGYFRNAMYSWGHSTGGQSSPNYRLNASEAYNQLASQSQKKLRIDIDQDIVDTLQINEVPKDITLQIMRESPEYEHLEANQGTGEKYLTMVVSGTEKQRQNDKEQGLEQVVGRTVTVASKSIEIERD
jgi:hypothetical protein